MIRELKTYVWTCDCCHTSSTVKTVDDNSKMPIGWGFFRPGANEIETPLSVNSEDIGVSHFCPGCFDREYSEKVRCVMVQRMAAKMSGNGSLDSKMRRS